MDWDSPTTKKHIAEAEAQGCVLLGEGKNNRYRTFRIIECGHIQEFHLDAMRRGTIRCQTCLADRLQREASMQRCTLLHEGKDARYRTYRLPCGHEQEIQLNDMRIGRFRCEACLQIKFQEEARSQACELLGPGKTSNDRTYRLPCGHKQIVQVSLMRRGSFRCQTCLDDKLTEEANVNGCVLLGAGSKARYRIYRLSCGHEQEIQPSCMRTGNFRCQKCTDQKLSNEAAAQKCEIIGAGKNANYRLYRLPCGHTQEVVISLMRRGSFRCQTCLETKLEEEARLQGARLIGFAEDYRYRTYQLPCGHNQDVHLDQIRSGVFQCKTCFIDKLRTEAEARGCLLLGPSSTASYRTYRLSCGHEQEVGTREMREGQFRCQTCEEYSYTLPSNTYLLHIKVGADEWLKLGYAKDVDFRATKYGLPSNAEVNVLVTKPFDTGLQAVRFEKSLHVKYRRKRLNAKQMAEFHTSGGTECYPATMVETLVAEFKKVK